MEEVIRRINILAIQGYNAGVPQVTANGSTLQTILNIVIGIIAALSVLFVVIGGMRYVLSAGDPQAANKAKETIIFALVGLVIAIIAESIVAFALKTIINNS
jgi:hypothetical protein